MSIPLLLATVALASVHPVHPNLSPKQGPVVEPVMKRARQELEAIAAKLPDHRLLTTASYGSWFLPMVPVGGDLDYLGIVDIGELPAKGVGEAAATRIEAWLTALASRAGRGDPTLALLEVEGLEEVAVKERARTVELVERAAAGQPFNVAYPLGEARAPYHFPAGVVSIPFHPRGKFLSNTFGLDPKVAGHVREVSIQFFFVARVGGRTLVLQPLYGRAAAPIELWRFVLEASFATDADRAAFAKIAQPGFDGVERRAEYAAFMLMVADIEIGGGRATKAAKRLAQAFLAVEPAAPAQLKARVYQELGDILAGKGAAYDDLAAVAGIHAAAAEAKALAPFAKSGDVKRLADGYRARLGKDDPEVARLLEQAAAGEDVWGKIKGHAKKKGAEHSPTRERLQALYDAIGGFLGEAGLHMHPVIGLEGDSVVLARKGFEALGVPDLKWPVAPWKYELRDSDARPVRKLYVRGPGKGWAAMEAALKKAPLRW